MDPRLGSNSHFQLNVQEFSGYIYMSYGPLLPWIVKKSTENVEIVYHRNFTAFECCCYSKQKIISLDVMFASFELYRLLKRLDFPELKSSLYFMGYEVLNKVAEEYWISY